jgi:hypothetical protein
MLDRGRTGCSCRFNRISRLWHRSMPCSWASTGTPLSEIRADRAPTPAARAEHERRADCARPQLQDFFPRLVVAFA